MSPDAIQPALHAVPDPPADIAELARRFLAPWPAEHRDEVQVGSLAVTLAAALGGAGQAWPGLGVPGAGFVAYLGARANRQRTPGAALTELRVSDLFLAFGCARRDPAAIAAFELAFVPRLHRIVTGIQRARARADDILQELRCDLLLAPGHRQPRIVQYRGRGSLAGWLEVCARRLALKHLRAEAGHTDLDEQLFASPGAGLAPEMATLRTRYGETFHQGVKQSLREGLITLSPEDRNLLRWHLVKGVSLRRIAALRGQNVSTLSRSFARVRAQLHTHVCRHLSRHTGLPTDTVASVAGVLLSRLSLTEGALAAD
jgi:RNA polymerase sigma-70 factor, ECF subfamily